METRLTTGRHTPQPVTTCFERQYRASAAIVGLSRTVIGEQGARWRLPAAMTDSLGRCVSELVSNAVAVSGCTDLIKIRLERSATCVILSVFDRSPRQPVSSAPHLTLEAIDALPDDGGPMTLPEFGGWGLPLVESLADAIGAHWIEPAPQSGKWIWAGFNF